MNIRTKILIFVGSMIVQYSNKRLEYLQFAMGFLVFTIFITYSLKDSFEISLTAIWSMIAIQATGLILTLRFMMRHRTMVKPYVAWSAKKLKTMHPNWTIRIISFIILTLLGGLHFYIVHYGGNDIKPLVYDYAIGGLVAFLLQYYMTKNWHIGISDKGIIFGSRFDSKLIEWKNIASYKENNGQIEIYCKGDASFKSITLNPEKQQREILLLLEQALG